MKRDITAFKTIKDRSHWRKWLDDSIATAASQGVDEPFDPNYRPSTAPEQELFDKKQGFVFQMLCRCIQTDHGVNTIET